MPLGVCSDGCIDAVRVLGRSGGSGRVEGSASERERRPQQDRSRRRHLGCTHRCCLQQVGRLSFMEVKKLLHERYA